MNTRFRRDLVISLALILVTCAVFSRVLQAEFVQWDDDINIYKNPNIQGLDAKRLKWMFTDVQWVRYYAPLAWLSVAVIHECSGLKPFGYHLANLLLHSANVVLVFFLLRKLLRARATEPLDSTKEFGLSMSCGLGALLWAVNPLRVEPVAWATGLSNCQALLFVLITLLCYLKALESAKCGRGRAGWYWAAVLAFVASLLTYPIGIGVAVVLVILDFQPLRRFNPGWRGLADAPARRIWLEKIPFATAAAMVLAFTLYRRVVVGGMWDAPVTLAQFGLLERIMQAFYIWACFLWRPWVPFDLSPVYTTLMWFKPFDAPFVLSFALVIGLSGLFWFKRRSWPGLLALWTAYLVILVPVLGWTEHPHCPNDRYSLIAGIAWAVLFAAGLFKAWEQPALRRKTLVGAGALAMLFGLLAFAQTRIWLNSETLFRHAVARVGVPFYRCDLYFRLGMVMAEQARLDEAASYYNEALRINPEYAEPHNGIAEVLEMRGRHAEALAHYQEANRRNPIFPRAHARIAADLARQGKMEEAFAHYQSALRLNPTFVEAMDELAWLRATHPEARFRNGAEAVQLAARAVELTRASKAPVLGVLAAAYAEAGDFGKAVAVAEQAGAVASAAGDTNFVTINQRWLEFFRGERPLRETPK